VQLCFIKRFLGLRASTHWVTLAESSRLPVYMFAYKRVCRYWNKLAQLGDRHLARLVLEESLQMHTNAQPTWAGLVLQLGSDLRVAPRYVPHEREHAWEATWHQPPDQPDIVVNREFCLREVARACSRCLEEWWCQWRSGVDNSSQLQLYGRLFLHREHLDTDNNYLYSVSMPVHLQQSLCMLRCFNLQLGVHSRRQGAVRTCTGCTVGCIEDEGHLLYGCSAYVELRQRYGVSGEHARRFQMHTVQATAKYIRHAMRARCDRAEQQLPPRPLRVAAANSSAVPTTCWTSWLQQCLCLSMLIMWGGSWLLGILLCLHITLEPMVGFYPNHKGP
jgi:hypothetical protein